jgi:hypothetical protein
MKSERRHELQHNDLAEWAVKTYESVLPYRNSIIIGTLLVAIVAIGLSIWRSRAQAQAAESWNTVEMPEAIIYPVYSSPEYVNRMDQYLQKYSGTPAGDWARILAADTYLSFGESLLMSSKEQAEKALGLALDAYKASLNSSDWMIRQRAMFGTAKILETQGKLADATAAYQKMNEEYPQGMYKAVADQRIERLGKPDTAEFYQALAQFTPKPPKESPAKESPRGKLEGIGSLPENPEEPALTPPTKPGSSGSGAGASPPKTSATELSPPPLETPKSTAAEPALPKPEAPKATAAEPAK